MIAWLLTAALLHADPDLSIDEAARIERDQQKAAAEVAKKFGNKQSSELSADERREMIREQADASREVLEKHGVDAKTWARSQHRTREEYAAQQAKVKELAEQEKRDEEARLKAQQQAPTEIPIQKGISDEKPVVLEETQGGQPIVEKGLPTDATADDEAAKDFDSALGSDKGDKKPDKPKKAPGRGKR